MMSPEQYWKGYKQNPKPVTLRSHTEIVAAMTQEQKSEILFEALADGDIDMETFDRWIIKTYL
ncbi:hypothetical protein [Dyadobacter sandarakinus]|uniref:Uncharacterized protein n=1 Tax=Dyadobacter sandarakinus TaxID=2747268 RepID=A0ABX7I1W6_9BACT|nr:hypothetical protein [Dyadobacter sandarakinus]QRQ99769.1 hypothetical protein HWI92_01955 [Dyadobacter sandarakinus]